MSDSMFNKMSCCLLAIYLIGAPVTAGVTAKMTENPFATILVMPIWPAAVLAYIGYRLAP